MTLINRADSYKLSHFLQYPKGTTNVSSYIEARGVDPNFGKTEYVIFFGLQSWIKNYLTKPISTIDVDRLKAFAQAHGVPFNTDFYKLVYPEQLPIKIHAVEEGRRYPIGTPLLQIENTDPCMFWLTSYLETSLLRAIWYPSTVATLSANAKDAIRKFWNISVEPKDMGGLEFALHDFGARGVSSAESAELGGMAHLLNFKGTDTIESIYAIARDFGNANFDEYMPAYSVPAAEHSTITSWGVDGEQSAYENMISQFGGENKIYSVVVDSYDTFYAVNDLISNNLLSKIKETGGRFVIRPDSGDPSTVILKILSILEERLGEEITINSKGYKVLPPYFRILQGDGVNINSIKEILNDLIYRHWSAENLVFGMGGALLQKVNRDSLKWAMKCNAISVDGGEWIPVSKKVRTDPTKSSKAGYIKTLPLVWDNGKCYRHYDDFEKLRNLDE